MRARCLHGYFLFEETRVGQVSDFMSRTGLSLVPVGTRYTFEALLDAPDYSLKGKELLLGYMATETFEGNPWDVFEANGVVFDFGTNTIKKIAQITQRTSVKLAGNRFVSPGLILPGSITDGGRVRDYSAWFSRDRLTWLYSEVTYV